ncbi:MAG: tRNA uridine(34) 5-carboxymethylaminomethyl modification radical SAM/GNAT enzyme Elp3 [Candidatus Gracilibacteria bacterium]|nr:tRNA uridine(34) 5-carboxymethylaminomethyl modification radical SAM/GNAT enzyme Elp3 [Candidatus Gracilibacteria bacterium]
MTSHSDIQLLDEILLALISDETIVTKDDFHRLKNTILAKYKKETAPTAIELISRYQELIDDGTHEDILRVRKVLRKRAIRSLSGVSVISLLTKFWGCPGKCIYCPTYDNLPKSYITDEPAVQRAELNQFDPFRQVQNRLQSLTMTGNAITKCDVRIIGGTWSVYPREYQEDFIRNIYDAHTAFQYQKNKKLVRENKDSPFAASIDNSDSEWVPSKTLEEAKTRNQTAESRVIGIAIETRPDWIDEEEIIRLRRYGVTRVEIGYQTTIDSINEMNRRGHGNKESIRATRLLKDAGFKVVAHMMPGLLGATPELDRESMQAVFSNPDFRPDELKMYPLVVTPHSELEEIWKRGEFEPYDDATLIPLMAELQTMIPEYVRLNRMYRDIPAGQILAGSKVANLRQITEASMIARGLYRHDISAREIRAKENNPINAILDIQFYEASGGHEYFLQFIDPEDRTIFGLARLRISSQYFTGEKHFLTVLENTAIVREVHVFGDQLALGARADGTGQHMGFGRRMMQEMERIVREKYPEIQKLAVISGVGVRQYYEKHGYSLEGEYMMKYL